jgi:hypothetical protein
MEEKSAQTKRNEKDHDHQHDGLCEKHLLKMSLKSLINFIKNF